MAFTVADLTAIDRAIASGAKSVKHGETVVIYQDTAAMMDARNRIIADLSAQGLITDGPQKRYFGRAVAKYTSGNS